MTNSWAEKNAMREVRPRHGTLKLINKWKKLPLTKPPLRQNKYFMALNLCPSVFDYHFRNV